MTHDPKKAGIAIDGWKQSIFERHLKAAGYTWEVREGLSPGIRLLVVRTINVMGLGAVVKAAEAECQRSKGAQPVGPEERNT